jgi:FKBP-type peptidyl-prolyl cis-trans isomerase FkpA
MTRTLVFFSALTLLLSSCGESSPFPGYEKAETGIYYKFFKKDEKAPKPKWGDYVSVILVRRSLTDSVLYDSRTDSRNANPDGTVEYALMEPRYKSGLESGLAMMGVSDSASFYVYMDSVKKILPPDQSKSIKEGQIVRFDFKLVRIRTREEVEAENQKRFEEFMKTSREEEPKTIENYLKTNNITVKPDKDSIWYIERERGKGPVAKPGSKVFVKYTGKYLDGNIFDASDFHGGQPYEFTIGAGQVIPGWDLGIQYMSKGGKATLLIPSSKAYGSMGMPDQQTGRYAIPPYTPLVFEVELVDIK